MKTSHVVILVVAVLLGASCNLVFEVGMENDGVKPAETLPVLTTLPTFTFTSTVFLPSYTPTTPPSPTPLPGSVVIPLSSMERNIPWLPLNKNRWPTTHVIMINTQLPPFNNILVRQAFAASIDRDVIVDMADMWYAVDPSPATSFIHPQTLGRDLYGEVGITFDPARAKDLLAQAGYTDPAAFPPVTFIVNSYGDTAPGARTNMAKALASMWSETLGITVVVQDMKPAAFGERLNNDPPEFMWVGWLPDPGNDPEFISRIFSTNAEYNYGNYSSPTVDKLLRQAASSNDPEVRQSLYIEAERLLCETETGVIPLYHTFLNLP